MGSKPTTVKYNPADSSLRPQDPNQTGIKYTTSINVQQLKIYIDEGDKEQKNIQDKDILLLIGKTGSGKSTTLHFLKGINIRTKQVSVKMSLNEKTIIVKSPRLEPVTIEQGFEIGHEMKSKTRFIKSIKCDKPGLMICDTPGFEDTHRVEIEIANSISITSAIQGCRSVKPLLLINYSDITCGRGGPIRDTLFLITRMINNIEKTQKSISIGITHAKGISRDEILGKLIELTHSNDFKSETNVLNFITFIAVQFEEKRIHIISPEERDQTELWKTIEQHPAIENPREFFNCGLGVKALAALNEFCKDALNFMQKSVKIFDYDGINQCLSDIQYIQSNLDQEFIESTYNQCIKILVETLEQVSENSIQAINDALTIEGVLSDKVFKEFKVCCDRLKQFEDKFTKQQKSIYQLSESPKSAFENRIYHLCSAVKEQCENPSYTFVNKFKYFIKMGSLITQIPQLQVIQQALTLSLKKDIDYKKASIEISLQKIFVKQRLSEQKDEDLITTISDLANEFQELKNMEELAAEKIGMTKSCDEIAKNSKKNFDDNLIFIKKKIDVLQNQLKQKQLDNDNNFENQLDQSLPQREMQLLRLFSENSEIAKLVPVAKQAFQTMKQNIIAQVQEQLSEMCNLLDKSSKNLKDMENSFVFVKKLRGFDESIDSGTQETYSKFFSRVQDCIQVKGDFIKEFVSYSKISEKQIILQDPSANLQKSMKEECIDYTKLSKNLKFFDKIKWLDKHLGRSFVEAGHRKAVKAITRSVPAIKKQCEQFIKEKNFEKLTEKFNQFTEFNNMNLDIPGLNDSFEKIKNCLIQCVQQKEDESENALKLFKKDMPTKNDWFAFHKYLVSVDHIRRLSGELIGEIDKKYAEAIQTFQEFNQNVLEQIIKNNAQDILQEAKNWKKILESINYLRKHNNLEELFKEFDEDYKTCCSLITTAFDDRIKQYNKHQKKNDFNEMEKIYKEISTISKELSPVFFEFKNIFGNLSEPSNFKEQLLDQITIFIKNGDLLSLKKIIDSKDDSVDPEVKKQQKERIKRSLQNFYQQQVKKICKDLCEKSPLKELSESEEMNYILATRRDISGILGKAFWHIVNKLISEELDQLIKDNNRSIEYMLMLHKYPQMEEKIKEYKLFQQLTDSLLPLPNDQDLGEPFFTEESPFGAFNTLLNETKQISEADSDNKVILFQEQTKDFLSNLKVQFENQQLDDEKEDIKKGKETLKNLQEGKKCNNPKFGEIYQQKIYQLTDLINNHFVQEMIEMKSLRKQGKLQEAEQKQKKISKNAAGLDDVIKNFPQLQDKLNKTGTKVRETRQNDAGGIRTALQKGNINSCDNQLTKLKDTELTRHKQEMFIIKTQAKEQLNYLVSAAKQKNFADVSKINNQIGSALLLKNHFSDDDYLELEKEYNATTGQALKSIEESLVLYHGRWINTSIKIVESDLNQFLCIQSALRGFSQQLPKMDQLKKLSNEIQSELLKRINQYNHSIQNNLKTIDLQGIAHDLEDLNKIQSLVLLNKPMSEEKEEERVPFINQDIVPDLVNAAKLIKTQEMVSEELLQIIKNQERICQNSLKEKNFKQVVEILLNLKKVQSVQYLFPAKENDPVEIVEQLKKKVTQEVDNSGKEAVKLINNRKYDEAKIVVQEVFDCEDLFYKIPDFQSQQYKLKIVDAFSKQIDLIIKDADFKNTKSFSMSIIEIKKIEDAVPQAQLIVYQKINSSLTEFRKDKLPNIVNELSDELKQQNDAVGRDIIMTHPDHFDLERIFQFNRKAAHFDVNTQVDKFIRKDFDKDVKLNTDLLKSYYKIYLEKYNFIVDERIKANLEGIEDIPKIIINNYNFKSWGENQKKIACELIASLFAYWTLSGMKGTIPKDKDDKIIKKEPNCTQVLSIFMLLGFDSEDKLQKNITTFFQNHIIEILTGEGKSITLGIVSSVMALMGYRVDVVCYSKYLSERDYDNFKHIFCAFKVDKKIFYGTFDDISNKLINEGGNIRELANSLIKGEDNNVQRKQKEPAILLIDEVDVFFGEQFYGETYNPIFTLDTKDSREITTLIWENKSKLPDQIVQLVKSSGPYLRFASTQQQWMEIYDQQIEEMIEDVNKYSDPEYQISDGKIGYKHLDGISFNKNYRYRTMFAYLHESQRGLVPETLLQQEIGFQIGCGSFSYASIANQDKDFQQYGNILGLTGTLSSLSPEQKKILKYYKIEIESFAPSMYGDSRLKFYIRENISVIRGKPGAPENQATEEWMMEIQRLCQKHIQFKQKEEQQSVIIFFQNRKTLKEYHDSDKLIYDKSQYQLILEESPNKVQIVKLSTRSGKVTLAMRDFGRGTDFICMDSKVENNGGVVVIQTFLAEDDTEERQIKGRTGRQGQEGSYYMVLRDKELKNDFKITDAELEEEMKGKNLYEFLRKKRNAVRGSQLLESQNRIDLCSKIHSQTMEFKQCLEEKKTKEASEFLIKFNTQHQNLQSNDSALHFIFVLDGSGSMSGKDDGVNSRWQHLMNSFQSFIEERQKLTGGSSSRDTVSVVYYDTLAQIVAKYEPIISVSQIVKQTQPKWGGTSFVSGINSIFEILQGESSQLQKVKKVVLFMSDGQDGASSVNRNQSIANVVSKFGHSILTWWNVGFGNDAGNQILEEMALQAKECKGEFKKAITPEELQIQFKQLSKILPRMK